MPKKSLDGTEIGTVHKKIGSKGMTKRVRGDMLGDAGLSGIFFNDALN